MGSQKQSKSAGSSSKSRTRSKRSAKTDARPSDPVATVPAPVSGPVPPGLNDVRGDEDPVLGHGVVVTKGEHEGAYGTFREVEGETAVIQPRSAPQSRITVPIADIKPADSFRR